MRLAHLIAQAIVVMEGATMSQNSLTLDQLSTATKEQLALWLAEQACPDDGENISMSQQDVHTQWGYSRFQDRPHAVCNGTGVRFPMLRKPCPHAVPPFNQRECQDCQGRGWLPDTSLEAAISAALHFVDPGYVVLTKHTNAPTAILRGIVRAVMEEKA